MFYIDEEVLKYWKDNMLPTLEGFKLDMLTSVGLLTSIDRSELLYRSITEAELNEDLFYKEHKGTIYEHKQTSLLNLLISPILIAFHLFGRFLALAFNLIAYPFVFLSSVKIKR